MPLLRAWGGEAAYGTQSGETEAALRRIGTPTIVVANVGLDGMHWRAYPELDKLLLGVALGNEHAVGDLLCEHDIPASGIHDVWQPGSPMYDSFPGLPLT